MNPSDLSLEVPDDPGVLDARDLALVRSNLLVELGKLLSQPQLELGLVLDTVVRGIAESLRDTAAVMMVSDDGRWLDFAALHLAGGVAQSLEGVPRRDLRFALTGSVVEDVVRRGRTLHLPDAAVLRDRHWSEADNPIFRAAAEAFPVRSMIAVPFRSGDEVLGVLVASRSLTVEPYSEADVAVAQVMADRTAPFVTYARRDAALRASEERFRRLSEEAPDIIYRFRVRPEQRLEYINGVVTHYTGYKPEELYQADDLMALLVHPDDRPIAEAISVEPAAVERRPIVLRWVRRDGEALWIEHRSMLLRDDNGDIVALEGIARDITDLKRTQDELAHQATHDHLTDLANRQLFTREVSTALARLDRHAGSVAVLFFDLDRFKAVNDGLGHAAGDVLLRAVAERLGEVLRPTDVPARLGGDEFGVLVTDADSPEGAIVVAERVQQSLREPFSIFDREIVTTASIGIAHTVRPDESADDLLRHADAAMYRAKATGGGHYELFDEALRTAHRDRLQVEQRLRLALRSGDLRVSYQPVIDLATDAVVAAEALVRWWRDGQLVDAADFIGIAEETDLVVAIGELVLRRVGDDARGWRLPGSRRALPVHVNASARELSSSGFEEVVAASFGDRGGLVLELLEPVLLEASDAVDARLRRLQERGVRLALDNFGRGYGSLAGLGHLDLDCLKLDRCLTAGVAERGFEAAILGAITAMAADLGIEATAEGVETDEQRAALVGLGCRRAQGHLLGRPMPADALTALLG